MEIQEALRSIGLTEKESAVYTALLQLGRASAYSVSEKSGLKKPTTYVILDELIEKGLARKVPRVKKQLYTPVSPTEAFAVAEEKLSVAKTLLPELLALTKGEHKKVNTLYFEGVRGIKQLLEYRLKEMRGRELVGFYAVDLNADPELVRYFKEEWGPGLPKRDIATRVIAPDHPSMKDYRDVDEKFGRTVKTVPYETYSSEVAIDVIGDVVRIHDYKNLQGVALENEDVAKTVRQVFEMLWAKL
jgi:sugar-specific transcriptional regulator TrmB